MKYYIFLSAKTKVKLTSKSNIKDYLWFNLKLIQFNKIYALHKYYFEIKRQSTQFRLEVLPLNPLKEINGVIFCDKIKFITP